MNPLLATMVNTCEQLLLLLSGPHALTSADRRAGAEEAILVLSHLEGALKLGKPAALCSLDSAVAAVAHPAEVRHYLADVIRSLQSTGIALG